MKIKNVSTSNVILSEIKDRSSGTSLIIYPGLEVLVFDEDAERSATLKQFITDGVLEITEEGVEPVELGEGESEQVWANKAAIVTNTTHRTSDGKSHSDVVANTSAVANKAAKTTAVAAGDSAVTAVVDASAQSPSYVQADVESIRTLANDLKVKYNAAVTLINELKAKIDTMNT